MQTPERGTLVVRADRAALAAEGAERFVALAQQAVATQGRFSVALSGGSTPRDMYEQLAQPRYRDAVDWAHTHIFWGDERYVPPDDHESSFRMAQETLLAHVPIPAANIYPVPTVGSTPEVAAASYAATLNTYFGAAQPRFDLIVLGLGPDGHVASLFPGSPAFSVASDELVIAVQDAPKPPPTRISFTLRLINAAAHVIFLVAGADKRGILREVLLPSPGAALFPARAVQPVAGRLTWLVDQDAAADLERQRAASESV